MSNLNQVLVITEHHLLKIYCVILFFVTATWQVIIKKQDSTLRFHLCGLLLLMVLERHVYILFLSILGIMLGCLLENKTDQSSEMLYGLQKCILKIPPLNFGMRVPGRASLI